MCAVKMSKSKNTKEDFVDYSPKRNLILNGDYINAFFCLSLIDLLDKIKSYFNQNIFRSRR